MKEELDLKLTITNIFKEDHRTYWCIRFILKLIRTLSEESIMHSKYIVILF